MRAWSRAIVAAVTAASLAVLPGCGENADERAVALGAAMEQVEGVTRVETSTPSGLFTKDVHATAFVDGPIDRATYDRVARAYRAYLDNENHGVLGGPGQVWIEGPRGRTPVPDDPARSDVVAGWVEELSDEGDPVERYEVSGTSRLTVAVTTTDPLATAQRLTDGDHALDPGSISTVLRASHPDVDAVEDQPLGVTEVDVELGAADTPAELAALDRAQEPAGESAVLRLRDGTLSITTEGDEARMVIARHEAVARTACPAVRLTTRSVPFALSGCGDVEPARRLLAALGDVEPRSLELHTDASQEQVVGLSSTQDLITVSEARLDDAPVLLTTGQSQDGLVSVGGRPADVRVLAPVAVAAGDPERSVIVRRASGSVAVDVQITGPIDDPEETFTAIRGAGWTGELTFGIQTPGPSRSAVRWTSTATGTAQAVGPLRGNPDEREMGAATKALVAAWDATAS